MQCGGWDASHSTIKSAKTGQRRVKIVCNVCINNVSYKKKNWEFTTVNSKNTKLAAGGI